MTTGYRRTTGYETFAEWEHAEGATHDARAERQGDAAARAFKASPRYAFMLAETAASGMRYGRDAGAEALAAAWLAEHAEPEAETDAEPEADGADVETLAALWGAAVDAGSIAYRYPDTIRHADYGTADALADAWQSLAQTGAHVPYGAASADAFASGLTLDPENHGRRSRWSHRAPWEAWRNVPPVPLAVVDGKVIAEAWPLVYINGAPASDVRRDTRGRKASTGRTARHASNAERQRAYRERKAAERAEQRAAAVVDGTPND